MLQVTPQGWKNTVHRCWVNVEIHPTTQCLAALHRHNHSQRRFEVERAYTERIEARRYGINMPGSIGATDDPRYTAAVATLAVEMLISSDVSQLIDQCEWLVRRKWDRHPGTDRTGYRRQDLLKVVVTALDRVIRPKGRFGQIVGLSLARVKW
jgi:hypothetical protein